MSVSAPLFQVTVGCASGGALGIQLIATTGGYAEVLNVFTDGILSESGLMPGDLLYCSSKPMLLTDFITAAGLRKLGVPLIFQYSRGAAKTTLSDDAIGARLNDIEVMNGNALPLVDAGAASKASRQGPDHNSMELDFRDDLVTVNITENGLLGVTLVSTVKGCFARVDSVEPFGLFYRNGIQAGDTFLPFRQADAVRRFRKGRQTPSLSGRTAYLPVSSRPARRRTCRAGGFW